MDEYGFSVISTWMNDKYGWIKDDNINRCNDKSIRYKERNDWKKDLLAIDMIIINISLNEENLWDESVTARGTTSVVQQ